MAGLDRPSRGEAAVWLRTPTALAGLRWFSANDPPTYSALVRLLGDIWDDPLMGLVAANNGLPGALPWLQVHGRVDIPPGSHITDRPVPTAAGHDSPWRVYAIHIPNPVLPPNPFVGVLGRPNTMNCVSPGVPLPIGGGKHFALLNAWSITADGMVLPPDG